MVRAVIIDVDDTLCLTEHATYLLENEALRRMGRPPMPRAVHIATWGRQLFEAITERSPGVDVDAFRAVYAPALQEYLDAGKLDVVPAQNYQAMDALIAAGKRLMLLTNREHSELIHMLAPDHGLAGRVTAFYYRENMQFHKPDPRAFNEVLQAHGLAPGECVYIGDSPSDAQAANQAGVHFVGSLEAGVRTPADFQAYHVDAFVAEFPGIVGAVAQLDAKQVQ
ncbi:MAG TPA: HAD family hydrolase [Candidatus Saccharimonadales bacterium]|nr:HAD family hydrolase [Candidatus Saccharimonadales bacterium]